MEFHRWWEGDNRERYWLEITDRSDLGVDLNVPQVGKNGRERWYYALIWEVNPGDLIFHYHRHVGEPAIAAWSRAHGSVREEEVLWAPQADDGPGPVRQAGWRLTLEGFYPIESSVTLAQIRAGEDIVRRVESRLEAKHGKPLYTPFETGRRAIRPKPAYLTKLPAEIVESFPSLRAAAEIASRSWQNPVAQELKPAGAGYRRVDEQALVAESDPFEHDPALIERSLRDHAATQNQLAEYVVKLGADPRSPRPDEPDYDLMWVLDGEMYVVEVKSIRAENEERQMRLAVGQVLRYRQAMDLGWGHIHHVIATSTPPKDDSWGDLLASLGIQLIWPGEFGRLVTTESPHLLTADPWLS